MRHRHTYKRLGNTPQKPTVMDSYTRARIDTNYRVATISTVWPCFTAHSFKNTTAFRKSTSCVAECVVLGQIKLNRFADNNQIIACTRFINRVQTAKKGLIIGEATPGTFGIA